MAVDDRITLFWDEPPKDFVSESDVELRLVEPLLRALGFQDDNISSKHPVVFHEGRVGRRPEADYVCFAIPWRNQPESILRDTSLLVVEAKAPGETLPPGKSQGESYAWNLRAPVLVLTNGENFEIWQLQSSQESVCCLKIRVADIVAERGRIEQLLNKESLISYCKGLNFKTLIEASADFGAYETAELNRLSTNCCSIERSLRKLGDDSLQECVEENRLLDEFPQGAVIVGQSGYGKTTLSVRQLQSAIAARMKGERNKIPFDVPLPDLVHISVNLIDYLHSRLVAHCPGISLPVFRQFLRETGVTLFCDSFDRVAAQSRSQLEADLCTFARDYSKAQVFILSMEGARPNIRLPILELEALTDQQMHAMEGVILDQSENRYSVIHLMPETLRMLCKNPLLLSLALKFWKKNDVLPNNIPDLFSSWLSTMLRTSQTGIVLALEHERALTIIAQATVSTLISTSNALKLLSEGGVRGEILNDLVNCDAIHFTGSVLGVRHEAMADYLRAKEIASNASLKEETLVTLPIAEGSFFPVFLMALLPSNKLQSLWWRKLSSTSITLYGEALRYRRDVSSELKALNPEERSYRYLNDLLDGIEMPTREVFPALKSAIAQHLIHDEEAELAVTGLLGDAPPELLYLLHPKDWSGGTRVTAGDPKFPGTRCYVNLQLCELRLDSGRLLGTQLLRDAVLKIVELQGCKGGPALAAERLIGRVRYLIKTVGLPIALDASLKDAAVVLQPLRDRWVKLHAWNSEDSFSIRSLLDDIELLRAASIEALDPWWLRLGWDQNATSQSDEVIAQLLDEHYRRVQLVYAEIIDTTFPKMVSQFPVYTALPLRWEITITGRAAPSQGSTVHYDVMPVADWKQAGANVKFSARAPDFADWQVFRDALERVGRSTSIFYGQHGYKPLFDFDGRQWTGHFDGGTPVIHEVCQLLKDELTKIFSAIPSRDGL